jgi:hypothetical protein
MPLLLLAAVVGTQTTAGQSPTRIKLATLNVRVFFGSQIGSHLPGPCSDIKIMVTPENGQPIVQAASGPQSAAKGGQCTASFKNVPAGVPVELKAVYIDIISKPDDSHDLPAGKWTNPLTLQAGSTTMKYLIIQGKP